MYTQTVLRSLKFFIVAITLISHTNAQTVYEPRPSGGLSSPIHTLREESYNCTGDPAERPWRVFEVTFDRRGNKTYQALFNTDGSIDHQASYKFNGDGNQIGWTEFYGRRDFPPTGLNKHADFTIVGGRIVSSVVYKEDSPEIRTTRDYDERGNMIREVTVFIGCCTTTRTFRYDSQNRLVENTSDSPGLRSSHLLTYDAAGNLVGESYYDNGVLVLSTAREFDRKRLLKEIRTSSDRRVRTTINTYSKNGDPVRIEIDDPSISSTTTIDYHANGKIRSKDQVTVAKVGGPGQSSEATPTPGRILEKYDSSGNQTERYIYDAKGALYSTQFFSYDEKGRQLGVVEKSSLGSMYSRDLVYKYDSYGNRIASLCKTGKEKLSLAEQKIITYYDK